MSSARKRKWAVKSETVVPTESFLHHKLLHLKAGPCSEPMEHRTKAHREQLDSVFIASMLGVQTQLKLMDSVSKMLCF